MVASGQTKTDRLLSFSRAISTSISPIVEYLGAAKGELYLPLDLLLEGVKLLGLGRQTQLWEI